MHTVQEFRRKVRELGEAIQRLPRPRQLELFAELDAGFRVVVDENTRVESAGETTMAQRGGSSRGHQ